MLINLALIIFPCYPILLFFQFGEDTQTITQYHFTSWPDHSVPEYGTPLMILRKKVMANWKKDRGPILVHCSAGVGRTGTFITIDIALEQAKTEGVVDIAGIVNRLREQRMQMVQTKVCAYQFYWCIGAW